MDSIRWCWVGKRSEKFRAKEASDFLPRFISFELLKISGFVFVCFGFMFISDMTQNVTEANSILRVIGTILALLGNLYFSQLLL